MSEPQSMRLKKLESGLRSIANFHEPDFPADSIEEDSKRAWQIVIILKQIAEKALDMNDPARVCANRLRVIKKLSDFGPTLENAAQLIEAQHRIVEKAIKLIFEANTERKDWRGEIDELEQALIDAGYGELLEADDWLSAAEEMIA